MLLATADRLSVLVVEDDSQLLRTLSDILRRRGYSTLTASSGGEGVALAQKSDVPPAVALVDLRLPDMDGLEVISRLRQVSELTETVVLTGHASLDTAVRALREHSCDYLVKPVAPDQLLPIVERAGERWHRRMAEEALRRNDERYRLLLENISDVIAVAGRDHTLRYISPSVVHVLGFEAQQLLETESLLITHPDDGPAFERFVHDTLALPSASGSTEVRVRHRDGSWRLLELSATNFLHRPEIGGLLYIIRDVTERRRFEGQVQHAQRMESIGSLAGGIAHDFNNVLSAIIGYGEMIAGETTLSDRTRADLNEMLSAAQRASGLTRQLLAFSRRQQSEPRVIDLNSLIDNLLKMLSRLIGESIVLRTELVHDVGSVFADPGQFEQVVMNLAVNARDAMPGGGTLTIETSNVTVGGGQNEARGGVPPGEYVLVTVRDSGAGMPPEVQTRAFEPFFTTKEIGKGTGLGLSTCYGIVTQAGGHITIESASRAGTSIHVYLPRVYAPVEPVAPKRAAVDEHTCNETILIVDDESAIRNLVVRILQRRGYRTLAAADAGEALKVIDDHADVHLLLTDVGLPGTNGVSLADSILHRRPDVKVLFMSGYDRTAVPGLDPLSTRTAHASIQKPFKPADILGKIREVLDA